MCQGEDVKVAYRLSIERPEHHYVRVTLTGQRSSEDDRLSFFMPCWSPGSYLMREYARHVRGFKAETIWGESLWFSRQNKGTWEVSWSKSKLKQNCDDFEINYEVYCHEFGVRNSHVDAGHAFIHGPSVFMGVEGKNLKDITLEVHFPPAWSKITTGLQDISPRRDQFLYRASNYDILLDSPLEIGCQETDGFYVADAGHELSLTGSFLPHPHKLKKDIQTICQTVVKTMGEFPCDRYVFLAHFAPEKFGGLEHLNSSALHFCPRLLATRKGYINWLSLVAHEYFHLWNGKRIRPQELGPFNYREEAFTTMLWLVEGLTSFMDDLFVLKAGLCTLEEYLEVLCKNINRYRETPGRMFDSLEESSFNAWIKLYRPDENSPNSSISYYLKGGLVFWVLNAKLTAQGYSINDLLKKLWERYKNCPEEGVVDQEVFEMVHEIGGEEIASDFKGMIQTTEEIDFEKYFRLVGLKCVWEIFENQAYFGARFSSKGERVFVTSVLLDSPAYKSGLNAGDEIIAIDGIRLLNSRSLETGDGLYPNQEYTFTVGRLERLREIQVIPGASPKILSKIEVQSKSKVKRALGFK